MQWWVQAQYIAAQLAAAGSGIEAAGDTIEQNEKDLSRAMGGALASIHSKVQGAQQRKSATHGCRGRRPMKSPRAREGAGRSPWAMLALQRDTVRH